MRDTSLALLFGGAAWLLSLGAYAAALLARERLDASLALLYNAPIALIFLVLVAYFMIQAWRLGFRAFLRVNRDVLVVWLVGIIVLYLRLMGKSLEVSGHMAWLPLLTVQSWVLGFPSWFTVFAALSTVGSLYLKLFVFRGPSGIPGAGVGMILAVALWFVTRRRADGSPTT